ncbi:nucleotidyl transferase AbiEii/AbiGii toxin family protein [Bifidobacterium sp. ESL0704]|uniref:nucleotidyl transferase AbiEii/AbiGii toxin family protein n=1 Tax=Bifidobacterium sp. ESL0704 TaxID=2983219 RepID=UPI0023F84A87|nr:nucleotidyl transferase AbiEii/AbiGii toxin family protein [Bifidobacterium sp. ESL0704]WEV53156.1 nucleotidyl transferase AbiEii/AbiGii toxin family protein [Bifidobacterium sp. ESL0704]
MTAAALTNQEIIDKALSALFSIDEFAGRIALHGGQALIAYNVSHRASQDIDLYVEENSITETERALIDDALKEQFNDSSMEVRSTKLDYLPIKTEQKKLARIVVRVADRNRSANKNRQTPIRRFGDTKSLKIEISLNNRLFCLDKINSDGVEIAVSSLVRIIYEKMLSLCQHTPSYLETNSREVSTGKGLRAKDLFDMSSILKTRPETKTKIIQADQIVFLKTMMKDIDVTKTDFLALKQDLDGYNSQYNEEYDNMSKDQIPLDERIDFTDAKAAVLEALTAILGVI